jgi:ribosomal protein S7
VPGAFMSMLGISFLNEIVRKQEITQANQILNQLRREIINALQQTGEAGEQKDGMDYRL